MCTKRGRDPSLRNMKGKDYSLYSIIALSPRFIIQGEKSGVRKKKSKLCSTLLNKTYFQILGLNKNIVSNFKKI